MSRPPIIIVTLIHISGPLKRKELTFSERRASGRGVISIGRHPSCDVRFPADLPGVSRKHANIIRDGNKFKLVDHSKFGTYVRGKKVKDGEIFLVNGDVLEFSEGGPKISFLMEIKEAVTDIDKLPSWPGKGLTKSLKHPEPPKPPGPPKPPEPPKPPKPPTPQRSSVALSIQYGPTLRSFNELPITIGRGPKIDFNIEHPAIFEHHAQIFYSQDQYWVKDLTGQSLVRINDYPIGVQAPLHPSDDLALSPQGPVFRFIGEGRLFEVEEPSIKEPSDSHKGKGESQPSVPGEKGRKKPSSFFKKFLK
jgi:pSer/pThr/pTyr-binding forkhead associated (FHA) protein